MRWLLILLLAGGLYVQREPILDWLYPPQMAASGDVIMYATRSCGYCAKVRKFFAEHNLAYEERDVERSEQARQEFQRYGSRGVPLFVIHGKGIKGYDERALQQLARR